MGASFDVQKGLYQALKAALTTPVFDAVPDNTAAPYTHVGDATEIPWDTDDSLGHETTVTIHHWSTYRGYKEVKDMMSAAEFALHEKTLTVFGQKVVMVVLEYAEFMLDSDGLTRHGVQRFRIITEGN